MDALIDEESTLLTRRRHREGLIQLLSRLYEVDVTAEAMGLWGHGVFNPGGVDMGGWFFIVSFSLFFDVNYQS